jgi:PAS domain S-box-containing protein
VVFRFRIIGAVLCLALLAATPLSGQDTDSGKFAANKRQLIAAVPRYWTPQYDTDADGKPIGFAIDVMNEVAARAGVQVIYKTAKSFRQAVRMLDTGAADLIPNSRIRKERLEKYAFSVPVQTYFVSIFVRKDRRGIESRSDLVEKRLGLVSRHFSVRLFRDRKDIHLEVFPSVEVALQRLLDRDIDALVYSGPAVVNAARAIRADDEIRVVGDPIRRIERAIRVTRSNAALLDILNPAVKSFVNTTAYDRLYEKWFLKPRPTLTVGRILWIAGGFGVFIVLAMGWWRHRSVVQLNRALREEMDVRAKAEQTRRALFAQAAVGIAQTALDGRFISVNQRLCEILGYSEEELQARTFEEITHPADLGRSRDGVRAMLSGEASEFTAEKRYVRMDGTPIWANVSVALVRDGQHRPSCFIAVLEDVTARKEMENRLRQAQKMEAVGQLTGGIAHDFNNILAISLGNIELAEEAAQEGGEVRRYLSTIKRANERGASLTNQLLAFSRKQTLFPRVVDVADLMTGMTDMLCRTIGEAIAIEISTDDGLWHCEVDPHQLEGALLNLAINARDAMPKGGRLIIRAANVRLGQEVASADAEVKPGDYVLVSVADTGTGMPEDVADQAFDPFFTTKPVGKGSGLGLSMVYGFVKQSGGHATVSSEIKLGTTVNLYLPRSGKPRVHAREGQGENAPEARGETVLVVEDDPEVRTLSISLVKSLGYETLGAGDGESALVAFESARSVDLLFTDVVLPGSMNGVELASEIRRRNPTIAVLYTSGYTDRAKVDPASFGEDTDQLQKPFKKADLARKLRQALDRAGTRAPSDPGRAQGQ